MSAALKLAIGSLVIGLAALALKTLAWWLTGSVALLSDALESTVNLATALAALVAIRVAARPADANHPFGHHKAEFLSAVLEGVMIVVAAVFILHEAYAGFLAPRAMEAPIPPRLAPITTIVAPPKSKDAAGISGPPGLGWAGSPRNPPFARFPRL